MVPRATALRKPAAASSTMPTGQTAATSSYPCLGIHLKTGTGEFCEAKGAYPLCNKNRLLPSATPIRRGCGVTTADQGEVDRVSASADFFFQRRLHVVHRWHPFRPRGAILPRLRRRDHHRVHSVLSAFHADRVQQLIKAAAIGNADGWPPCYRLKHDLCIGQRGAVERHPTGDGRNIVVDGATTEAPKNQERDETSERDRQQNRSTAAKPGCRAKTSRDVVWMREVPAGLARAAVHINTPPLAVRPCERPAARKRCRSRWPWGACHPSCRLFRR